MDSPILPNRTDEERSREREDPYVRWGTRLRFLAAAAALAGALIGLASQLHHHKASPLYTYPYVPPVGLTVFYGQPTSPAALKPGKANDAARVVCNDEVRWEPTSGKWHCVGFYDLRAKDVARVARDPGGACTHRVAGFNSPTWKCVATSPVPEAARNAALSTAARGVIFGGMRDGSDFCSEEARANATHGAWTCTNWRPIPSGFRFVEATAAPGPCAFRAADQQTGEWSCNPTIPGL